MFMLGAVLIGVVTAIAGYPVFDFETGQFSIINLILIAAVEGIYTILFYKGETP